MTVDVWLQSVEARLREASRMAGSWRPEARLETKVDMRGTAVAARLKEASDLLDVCRALSRNRTA